jgi:hypothetical protein
MNAPAARRDTLVLVAGIVWSLVGLMLAMLAIHWLATSDHDALLMAFVGCAAGYLIFRFGFSRLVHKNLIRIYEQSPQKEKVCVFAFQNIRSYIIVIVMMAMGYGLRHSSIPRIYLAPLYLAIGIGLTLSSLLYYNRLRTISSSS